MRVFVEGGSALLAATDSLSSLKKHSFCTKSNLYFFAINGQFFHRRVPAWQYLLQTTVWKVVIELLLKEANLDAKNM